MAVDVGSSGGVEKVGGCWIDYGNGAVEGEVGVVVVDSPEVVLMVFLFPTSFGY